MLVWRHAFCCLICCKALGTPGFSAEVHFGEPRIYPDRRIAADQTHAEITAMRNGERCPENQEAMQSV